jgi:chromosome partitioning protein
MTQVLAVVNRKGGSTKTTSSAFLAHALYEQGYRVLLVDSDPQQSALSWSETAEWPLPVVGLPTAKLHRELPGITGDRFDWVVIDTPPLEKQEGIVMSALRAADYVLVPVAASPIEYQELAKVRAAIADSADLRHDGESPLVAMLLTRTTPGTLSTGVWRDAMLEDGDQVLGVTVGHLQQFSQSFGRPITSAAATAYGEALRELLGLMAAQRG